MVRNCLILGVVTHHPDDLKLVHDAAAGSPEAGTILVPRIAEAVWPVCRRLTATEAAARDALAAVLRAVTEDNFEALRIYDGRARLATFLIMKCREFLAERLLCLLREDPSAAWGAFEAMFRTDIDCLIQRRLPGPHLDELRREAYQEISLALLADRCRRLRAYRGQGGLRGIRAAHGRPVAH